MNVRPPLAHGPDEARAVASHGRDADCRVIAIERWRVPRPFSAFAVRSEEARHADVARTPLGCVYLVRADFLDRASCAAITALGRKRMSLEAFSDIAYAPVGVAELAAVAPAVADWVGAIAQALGRSGVLGDDAATYQHLVAARIDFLGSYGAGFHNDVAGHWTACLFWNLTLFASDVEFVMPHAGLRLALHPGDLLVFDPALAHGLCRPRDAGQAVAESFDTGADCRQIFLSGELPLDDAQWAALGAPWMALDAHPRGATLDLTAAEFDERSGAIKGLRALAACMRPGTRYVDDAALPASR